MTPKSDAREANGIELENKAPTNNTGIARGDSQPRVSSNQDTDSDEAFVQKNAQAGVQKMEATTQIWSKQQLVAAYAMCVRAGAYFVDEAHY